MQNSGQTVGKGEASNKSHSERPRRVISPRRIKRFYSAISTPVAIVMLSYSPNVHPAYKCGWWRRIILGCRFCWNNFRVTSGTSWRAHMVMAMRLLETPPQKPGCVVECGCYKGGASVNLSLVCRIVGRKFKIYDSFEGLPPPSSGDYVAEDAFKNGFIPGVYRSGPHKLDSSISAFPGYAANLTADS